MAVGPRTFAAGHQISAVDHQILVLDHRILAVGPRTFAAHHHAVAVGRRTLAAGHQIFAVAHQNFAVGLVVGQSIAYTRHSVALGHLIPIVHCNLVMAASQDLAVDYRKVVAACHGLSAAHQNFVVAHHNSQEVCYHLGQCILVLVALGNPGVVQHTCAAFHRKGGPVQKASHHQAGDDCH